jgi:hypothetical protein
MEQKGTTCGVYRKGLMGYRHPDRLLLSSNVMRKKLARLVFIEPKNE